MKNLTSIPNELLHMETLQAASNEKAATLILLEHLAEIDRRRLYAMRGYASLWEYVHKALQYSESQAYDRVSAMRLMVRVPEVKTELQSGKLTLTTTAKLGAHVRREKLRPEETVSLLREISGKPSREVERVLVSQSTEPRKPDRVKAVTPELARITLDVDQEFLKLVQKVKDLKGNSALSHQDVFKTAMQDYVKRRQPKPEKHEPVAAVPLQAPALLRAPEVKTTPEKQVTKSRYIPMNIRTMVRVRSEQRCEYADPVTKRRCESKSGLQFDHINPFAKGGAHTFQNLRHYCKAHNTLAAIEQFGGAKMRPYLKL
ncbi:MAG: HNH endonuclease [Deltaproteobacteria bacterium]|nr:HNH endonuclease [Deltaproteobacteria bacterium]